MLPRKSMDSDCAVSSAFADKEVICTNPGRFPLERLPNCEQLKNVAAFFVAANNSEGKAMPHPSCNKNISCTMFNCQLLAKLSVPNSTLAPDSKKTRASGKRLLMY
jgi:hypothetical protein